MAGSLFALADHLDIERSFRQRVQIEPGGPTLEYDMRQPIGRTGVVTAAMIGSPTSSSTHASCRWRPRSSAGRHPTCAGTDADFVHARGERLARKRIVYSWPPAAISKSPARHHRRSNCGPPPAKPDCPLSGKGEVCQNVQNWRKIDRLHFGISWPKAVRPFVAHICEDQTFAFGPYSTQRGVKFLSGHRKGSARKEILLRTVHSAVRSQPRQKVSLRFFAFRGRCWSCV